MGNAWSIIGLVGIVIALAFIFPESLKLVLKNRIYMLGLILSLFLIGFAIFIKINQR